MWEICAEESKSPVKEQREVSVPYTENNENVLCPRVPDPVVSTLHQGDLAGGLVA